MKTSVKIILAVPRGRRGRCFMISGVLVASLLDPND